MPRLEIAMLGPFSISLDGAPLNGFRSDRVRALLAYLALQGGVAQRREGLASVFWPGTEPASARASLRVALSNLRQVLKPLEGDPPLLDVTRQSVRLDVAYADCWIDVVEFDALAAVLRDSPVVPSERSGSSNLAALERMVSLWRGELLSDFPLPDSQAFDEWFILEQEMRHRQVLAALNVLVEYHAAHESYAQVRDVARQMLALEPWSKEGHRHLMWSLAQSGERSAALAQYDDYCQVLHREFGVEPGPEMVTLFQQIRDGALGWQTEGAKATLIVSGNPYKGLQTFQEDDAPLFFGRDALVERIVARLDVAATLPGETAWMSHFLAIVGPSGSGKSSLVRAGLIPAMRRTVQSSGLCRIAIMFPGVDPLAELAAALVSVLPDPAYDGREQDEDLVLLDALRARRDPDHVRHLLQQRLPAGERLLLVIDQFGELYTLVDDPDVRQYILDLVLHTLRAPDNRLCVVVTLRADHYGFPLGDPSIAALFQSRVEVVLPLSPKELRQAIVGPATLAGVALEPDLVAALIADAGHSLGALPLLEYALTELYERRQERTLRLRDYRDMGRLSGALAGRADELYAGLDLGEQEIARQLLLRLISLSGQERGLGLQVVLRRAQRSELFSLSERRTDLSAEDWRRGLSTVINLFGRYRLLTFDQDAATGQPTAEIAHATLVETWERLRDWLAIYRHDLQTHAQLDRLSAAWEQAGRDPSYLARGQQLALLDIWHETTGLAQTQVERDYLGASLAQQQEEQALEERRHAHEVALGRRAQSLALISGARLALNERDTDLALALSMTANRMTGGAAPLSQAQLMLSEAAYAPGVRRRYFGHKGGIEDLALCPDGRTFVSASADRTLIRWDLESGEAICRYSGHDDAVHAVVTVPDDKSMDGCILLSGSADGTLILWDLEDGKAIRRFTGHEAGVRCLAVVPVPSGGEGIGWALSGSDDHILILWNLATGETVRRLEGHGGAVLCVAIDAQGQTALSGAADGSIIHWNLSDGAVIRHFAGQSSTIDSVMNAPRGHHSRVWDIAFSTGHDTQWDDYLAQLDDLDRGDAHAREGARARKDAYGQGSDTSDVDVLRAVSVSQDQHVIIWDLATGEIVARHLFDIGILSLADSTDGRHILLGLLDGRVIVIALDSGQTTLRLLGPTSRVLALAYVPGQQSRLGCSSRHVLAGAADGTLWQWDLDNGAEIRRLVRPWAGCDLSISPDGQRALTALWDGDIELWSYETGRVERYLRGHQEMVFAGACFTPDGRRVVSGSGDLYGDSQDNSVRLWDADSGQELCRFPGHERYLWNVTVSPDGRTAASCGQDGTLQLWSLDSGVSSQGQILVDVAPQAVRSMAYSPDGGSLLLGLTRGTSAMPDYSLRLVDTETGDEIHRFSGHDEAVAAVVFGPKGRLALSGSLDHSAILWDVESGQIVHRLVGHRGNLTAVAFGPEGRLAASADMDGLVLLWDVAQGTLLRRFAGHNRFCLGLAFTPGGETLLSVGGDDTVREWRIDRTQEELLDWIAANRHVPQLAPGQREQYLISDEDAHL